MMQRRSTLRHSEGFTVIEVLFALSLLMVLMAATTNMALGTYKSNQQVQQRNQITQIMMGMGRRILAQDPQVLPVTGQSQRNFTAAELQNLGFQNTTSMTAQVTADSDLVVQGSALNQYRVQVCWTSTCVQTSVAY